VVHQFIEKAEGKVRVIAIFGIELVRVLRFRRLQSLQVSIGIALIHDIDGCDETLLVVLLDLLSAEKFWHCYRQP
jgi:hypothetical protein